MATTPYLQLNQPAYNSSAWDVPLNANETILDNIFGATTSISLTNSNVNLTSTQIQSMQFRFTGALSANVIIYIPAGYYGRWTFTNATTGTYTVTIASASGGTTQAVPQGYSMILCCDSTGVFSTASGLIPSITSLSLSGTLTVSGSSTFNGAATFNNSLNSTANSYSSISSLTDGATITPNFATANNFTVTLGGNRTFANPTNLTAGQSGVIYFVQDATGGRTVSFGSYWKFPDAIAPTLTATASAVDAVAYVVRSTTYISAVTILNFG